MLATVVEDEIIRIGSVASKKPTATIVDERDILLGCAAQRELHPKERCQRNRHTRSTQSPVGAG